MKIKSLLPFMLFTLVLTACAGGNKPSGGDNTGGDNPGGDVGGGDNPGGDPEPCAHPTVNHMMPTAPTYDSVGYNEECYVCASCNEIWRDADMQYHFRASPVIAKKTHGTEIDPNEISNPITEIYTAADKVKGWDQTDWENYPNGKGAGTVKFYNIDGHEALFLSANLTTEQYDALITSNYGYSECRFEHASTNLTSVTFEYKYYDMNTSAVYGTESHTVAQTLYNGNYTLQYLSLINDNEWHTATINTTPCPNNSFLLLKIQQFVGEIYISNMTYNDSSF